jgi:hypothetical protein
MNRHTRTGRDLSMTIGGVVAALGLGAFTRGAWLAWHPLGWMMAGIFLAVPSLLAAYAAFREK